jgi:putative hydrolase of the HAD superfamily
MTEERSDQAAGIAAVVFDLDGTLYPFIRTVVASTALVLRDLRFFRAFGRTRRSLRHLAHASSPPGAALAEVVTKRSAGLQRAQTERLAALLRLPDEAIPALLNRHVYRDWAQSFQRVAPFPGVARTLAGLRERGMRLGVLSDSPLVVEKLGYLGIEPYWDVTLAADQAGGLKPDPVPFRYMAERLDLPPSKILFVGNHYAYDIVGANGVGMLTAHFSRRRVPYGIADYTFSRYRSFPELPASSASN